MCVRDKLVKPDNCDCVVLLQAHPLQLTNMFLVHVQAGVQVGGGVPSHEHGEQ